MRIRALYPAQGLPVVPTENEFTIKFIGSDTDVHTALSALLDAFTEDGLGPIIQSYFDRWGLNAVWLGRGEWYINANVSR